MSDDPQKIPRAFHSAYLEAPFTECIDCQRLLDDTEGPYLIVKSFVGTEAVFEMAICLQCAHKMRSQYSAETKQNLQVYLTDHLELNRNVFVGSGEDNESDIEKLISERISRCVICQKPQPDCHRYEIVGHFFPNKMLQFFPEDMQQGSAGMAMMMCDDCNSKMSDLISKQTRDSWDRFVEDHFDGPPGIELGSPSFEPILL